VKVARCVLGRGGGSNSSLLFDPELRAAFKNENIQFQTDLIHGFRILGYKLWEDNALDLKHRKDIINELKALLLSLKNVVVFHKSEADRIGEKINQVVDGLESLANRLKDMGCPISAKFIFGNFA